MRVIYMGGRSYVWGKEFLVMPRRLILGGWGGWKKRKEILG